MEERARELTEAVAPPGKTNQKHVRQPLKTASRSPRGVQLRRSQGEILRPQRRRARTDPLGNPRHGRGPAAPFHIQVDETGLQDRLKPMSVSVSYEGPAVPAAYGTCRADSDDD